MKSAQKRTFSLLFAALVLISALVLYVYFVRPAFDNIQELRGILQSKEQLYQDQNLAIGQVSDLIAQYRGTGDLQNIISQSFPLKEELSSIFNQLRSLASVNGLSIEIFGVKPQAFKVISSAPLVKETGTLQLSVRLIGSYAALKNFLSRMETNIRVMDLHQLTIERLGASNADLFAFNLVINTYYQASE